MVKQRLSVDGSARPWLGVAVVGMDAATVLLPHASQTARVD
jgi:hypothetical protein